MYKNQTKKKILLIKDEKLIFIVYLFLYFVYVENTVEN